MNCWNILGIPPQTDLAAIRAAYAEKTRACHPEEDPEGFAALHEAYRAAMVQARQWRSRPAEAESAEPEPVAQKVGLLAPLEEQGPAPEPEEDLFAGTEFAHDAIRPEELRHLEEEPTPEGLAKASAEALARSRLGNSESLVYGLVIGLRFATVCMWLESMFQVVSSDKVVYLFGKVSPLLALFLTILLRLIPRIGNEARRINLAQKGIGRGSNQGNLFQRLMNCLRIFSMLITWMIFALALESDSMRSRGSLLRHRTAFSIYRFDNRDRAFVIGLFFCITLTIMGIILGATDMWYNPRILWNHLDGLEILTAMDYLTLCLMPMGLELWTEYRFRAARKRGMYDDIIG